MVIKVHSSYKIGAPKQALKNDETRFIENGPLYPDLLDKLGYCQVNPVTRRTDDFMAIHRIDLGDVRKFAIAALTTGTYLNSQWCNGNAPRGIFACDSYAVLASIYSPKDRMDIDVLMYIKLCITDTGNTVAVISLHDSTDTKETS